MNGLSLAFVAALEAIASRVLARPLPPGLVQCEIGDWKLSCNNGKEPIAVNRSELAGYSVLAEHKVYLVICVLDAAGGIIGGGMTEDEFIAEMEKLKAMPA